MSGQIEPVGVVEAMPAVPSREQIERLQSVMSAMPQVEIETKHYFVPGMYSRTIALKAGTWIVGKVHKTHHFCILAAGRVLVASDEGRRMLEAGDVLECHPGAKRAMYAVTDSLWINVHKTDKTDKTPMDELENELVEPDETAMFGVGNVLKDRLPQTVEQIEEIA